MASEGDPIDEEDSYAIIIRDCEAASTPEGRRAALRRHITPPSMADEVWDRIEVLGWSVKNAVWAGPGGFGCRDLIDHGAVTGPEG